MPEFTPDEFRRDLDDHLSDLQIEMLVLFASTKNMTEVARLMGLKQPKTRSLILDALAVMACEPEFARYSQYFSAVMRRIGHQVKREASSSKAARLRSERLQRVKSAAAQ